MKCSGLKNHILRCVNPWCQWSLRHREADWDSVSSTTIEWKEPSHPLPLEPSSNVSWTLAISVAFAPLPMLWYVPSGTAHPP